MTKRFGFTLAEVLITLGIIGVVAAMTMPTLINQTNGAQYKAAYKKALSAISQAITLNVALEDIGFADAITASTKDQTAADSISGILRNRMNVVKTDNKVGYGTTNFDTAKPAALSDGDANTVLFFNDGSMISFLNSK